MADRADGFYARWSRRKRRAEPPGDTTTSDAPAPADREADEPAAAESEIVDQLPDIDSLDENADFTVFLKKGVPEELRRRALRRLWRLNPVFANLDGLNEYDEDFTAAANMLEGLKSVYQVGKGMPDPAEPPTGGQETSGVETIAAPAGEDSAPENGNEAPDEGQTGQVQPIPEAGVTPIADQGRERPPRQQDEVASVGGRSEAGPVRSRRSAAVRRWGRFEG